MNNKNGGNSGCECKFQNRIVQMEERLVHNTESMQRIRHDFDEGFNKIVNNGLMTNLTALKVKQEEHHVKIEKLINDAIPGLHNIVTVNEKQIIKFGSIVNENEKQLEKFSLAVSANEKQLAKFTAVVSALMTICTVCAIVLPSFLK